MVKNINSSHEYVRTIINIVRGNPRTKNANSSHSRSNSKLKSSHSCSNNNINAIFKPLYIAIASIILGVVGLAGYVSATAKTAGPLEVNYDGDTIFSEANIAPGFASTKTITIKNNGTIDHSFALATGNVVGGELANAIELSAVYEGNTIWKKTIAELSNLAEVSVAVIDNLPHGQTGSVDLRVGLSESAGNEVAGKNLSFDLMFGTQEPEALSGEIMTTAQLGSVRMAYGTPSSIGGEDEVKDESDGQTVGIENGEVQGASTSNNDGKNKWLLLIVPGAAVGGLSFVRSCKRRNIGIPLFFGAAAFLISNYLTGDMDQNTFMYLLGGEVLVTGGIKMVIKDKHKEYLRSRRSKKK